jgi:hypothetical protein
VWVHSGGVGASQRKEGKTKECGTLQGKSEVVKERVGLRAGNYRDQVK